MFLSLCLTSDQRRALFRRLRSAGCQLPVGHRYHLPAQRRMREEDLHPGRIHADGCRLVAMQSGARRGDGGRETVMEKSLWSLSSWQMFGSVALQTNTGEPRLSVTGKNTDNKKDKRLKVEDRSLLGNQRLRGYLPGLCWAGEGTERFRGCCKRTITPP